MSDHDHRNLDLLIVGGGPVGVAMGLFAAQRGMRASVVERDVEVYNTARAIGMDDEVQRIFQNAGLGEALGTITQPMDGAEFVTSDGERIIGVDIPPGTVTMLGHAPTVFYHQPDLEHMLRNAAVDAGVGLLLGSEVIGFRDSGGDVETTVRPVGGAEHVLHSRWLVGADGASSGVRKRLGVDFDDLGFDQDWLVVDTRLERDVELPRCVQQICDRDRPTTFVPGFDRARRWEFQLQPGESRSEMEHHDRVWDLLSPWMRPGDATIERAVVYRFHATVASTMRVGNVFLAGDAAHQMPPFLGQGLCSGIRDAANLAWRLQAVTDGQAYDRLLDAYDTERRPHATAVVAHAVETGKLIDQLAGRLDAGVGTKAAYGGDRPFPSLEVGQLAGDHPLVGRQLPQPTFGGVRLDERLGPGWSVIVADVSTAPESLLLRWLAIGARIVPLGASFADVPFAPDDGVIIVRPDRIVAAVARTSDEAVTLSEQLFGWFADGEPSGMINR